MAEGFNPKEKAKEIAKKAAKRHVLTVVITILPSLLFGLFIIVIVYLILNPFQFLFGMDGKGSSDSDDTAQTQTQKDIADKATKDVENLTSQGVSVDKYLAISSGFYGISYNMNDTTDDDNATSSDDPDAKYKSEIMRFIDVVTKEGQGLTEYKLYCKDEDNKVYCGTEDSNTCSTTCKNGTDRKLSARSQDEYKQWLVSSGELETHLKNVGYEFSTDDTEKAKQLSTATDEIVDNENLYKESYSSSIGSFGADGSLEDGEAQTVNCNSSIWDDAYVDNPFVYRGGSRCATGFMGEMNQCTTFAWYMFNKYYVVEKKFGDYDYQNVRPGHGNGYQWAYQICISNPGQFSLSDKPRAGAIISCYGYSDCGHVAFVTKVEGDTFWVSEGNAMVDGYAGGIFINHKYTSVAQYAGNRHVIFAVPCAGEAGCGDCTRYTDGLD